MTLLRGRVAHGLVGAAAGFCALRAVETLPWWVRVSACAITLTGLRVGGVSWEHDCAPSLARRYPWLRWSMQSDPRAAIAFPAGGVVGVLLFVLLT